MNWQRSHGRLLGYSKTGNLLRKTFYRPGRSDRDDCGIYGLLQFQASPTRLGRSHAAGKTRTMYSGIINPLNLTDCRGSQMTFVRQRKLFHCLLDGEQFMLARGSAGVGDGPNKRDFSGFGGNRNMENSQVYRHLHRLPFSANPLTA